jgi:hypothetical protein
VERSRDRIEREVGSWAGVTVHPHRFGGIEFRLGRHEIGHLHGDHLADLPFRKPVRDMLVETRRAEPHHRHPDPGWVSKRIVEESDVDEAIELFRLGYERARIAQIVTAAKASRP